jgi:hypothetical protein
MYQTFVKEGRFKDVMEDIFEAGKRLVRVGAAHAVSRLIKLADGEVLVSGFQTASSGGRLVAISIR